jgi:FkbM family methyltransferase
MLSNSGFLYRRLAKFITCSLKLGNKKSISLESKHHLSSFQDVFLNPFYWECLLTLKSAPKIIVDLGANFGYFSTLTAQINNYRWPLNECRYLLVEANKNLIAPIKKTLIDVGVHNFEIFNGLAGPIEQKKFNNDRQNLLASKIGTEGDLTPFIDLNSVIFKDPDIIKIDIEGAEFELFDNYFDWIASAKVIIIEFHEIGVRHKKIDILLSKTGFKCMLERKEDSGYINSLYIK